MLDGRSFDDAFRLLRNQFTAKTKQAFLKDIRGQLEEDDEIKEIIDKRSEENMYVAITFDRKRNDSTFSYDYFDVVLITLDAISGGRGIYKPSNQMRALRWNSTGHDLIRVLRYLGRYNPRVMFRRALVLPFPYPSNWISHRRGRSQKMSILLSPDNKRTTGYDTYNDIIYIYPNRKAHGPSF